MIGPVLAAILGAFLTYVFQKILNWQNKRQRKTKLREALRAELIQMEGYRESVEKAVEKDNPSIEALYILAKTRYPFFESNADKLVELNSMEQVRLVRFYGYFQIFQAMSEKMLEGSLTGESNLVGMTEVDSFLDKFEDDRQAALEEIEKNL